jgi:hypothetical protein
MLLCIVHKARVLHKIYSILFEENPNGEMFCNMNLAERTFASWHVTHIGIVNSNSFLFGVMIVKVDLSSKECPRILYLRLNMRQKSPQ